MIHYIENEYLKVGVKEFGAEITSIVSKKSGFEFMWQGNPEIWSGQAPILFPIVGRLIDDKYTYNGTEYEMQKHGFARKMKWEFIMAKENSLLFKLFETDDTLKIYPFIFDYFLEFVLEKNRLTVKSMVVNLGDEVMYFSLGAHPAFNCEIGDVLRFDKKETLDTEKIDLVNSLRLPKKFPVLRDETDIVITKDIFAEDALILSGINSECVTLLSNNHSRKVRFNLGNAPYLGIWAKPGAPYVCIEPWYGVNDSTEKKADISQKEGIFTVDPHDLFKAQWWAEFEE